MENTKSVNNDAKEKINNLVRSFKKDGSTITDTTKVKPAVSTITKPDLGYEIGSHLKAEAYLSRENSKELAEMRSNPNPAIEEAVRKVTPKMLSAAADMQTLADNWNPMFPHWKRLVNTWNNPNVIPTWNIANQKYYIGYSKETGVYIQRHANDKYEYPVIKTYAQMLIPKGSIQELVLSVPMGWATTLGQSPQMCYGRLGYRVPTFLTETEFKAIVANKPSYDAVCNAYELYPVVAEDNTKLDTETNKVVW